MISGSAATSGPLLTDDALIEAAEYYLNTEVVDAGLAAEAREVLRATLIAGELEYVSLVGTDTRVIASGGPERQGNVFNLDDLVATALKKRSARNRD